MGEKGGKWEKMGGIERKKGRNAQFSQSHFPQFSGGAKASPTVPFTNINFPDSPTLTATEASAMVADPKRTTTHVAPNAPLRMCLSEYTTRVAQRARGECRGRFRTARAQRGHSANYYVVYPGNTP